MGTIEAVDAGEGGGDPNAKHIPY